MSGECDDCGEHAVDCECNGILKTSAAVSMQKWRDLSDLEFRVEFQKMMDNPKWQEFCQKLAKL